MSDALERFTAKLSREPGELTAVDPDARRAAVSMLLRFDEDQARVLLMTRREHPDDPWSGHVSLPGGREEEGDENLFATAVRETQEEVGVDLNASARLLGRLEPLQARVRNVPLDMYITPFVFARTEATRTVVGVEAIETFWFPLVRTLDGEHADVLVRPDGRRVPCWRYEGRVIWGLTFEMLNRLLHAVYGRRASEMPFTGE